MACHWLGSRLFSGVSLMAFPIGSSSRVTAASDSRSLLPTSTSLILVCPPLLYISPVYVQCGLSAQELRYIMSLLVTYASEPNPLIFHLPENSIHSLFRMHHGTPSA